jgi:hypothetical protein
VKFDLNEIIDTKKSVECSSRPSDPAFDLEITGFDMGQIDTIMDGGDVDEKGIDRVLWKGAQSSQPNPDDAVSGPERQKPAVTLPGSIWTLGRHRLICADATKPESYDQLLGLGLDKPETVELVFTDPPYNVSIAGHVSGLGKVTHREFRF